MDAKQYEHLGKRMRIKENAESLTILKDESIHNMKEALCKDGTTGFLSEKDGVKEIQPFNHKGFFCQIFQLSDGFKGFAREIVPQTGLVDFTGKSLDKQPAEFETSFFSTEHECGQILVSVVDAMVGKK